MANVMKRAVVITTAMIYTAKPVTPLHIFGVLLSVFGKGRLERSRCERKLISRRSRTGPISLVEAMTIVLAGTILYQKLNDRISAYAMMNIGTPTQAHRFLPYG